jgi:hypothetical protein
MHNPLFSAPIAWVHLGHGVASPSHCHIPTINGFLTVIFIILAKECWRYTKFELDGEAGLFSPCHVLVFPLALFIMSSSLGRDYNTVTTTQVIKTTVTILGLAERKPVWGTTYRAEEAKDSQARTLPALFTKLASDLYEKVGELRD